MEKDGIFSCNVCAVFIGEVGIIYGSFLTELMLVFCF